MMTLKFYKEIRPENLPMPDRHIISLIRYVLKEDAQIDELSKLVAYNPALTAQVLGVANSAFFRLRKRILTISDAVVTMGMKHMKNLVLCFAVKDCLSQTTIPGFDIDQFWGDSILRAVAAMQLGQLVNGPKEEAFSIGMLQDIGLLILFTLEPQKADRWPLLRANLPDRRRQMENSLFRTTHDLIGNLVSEKWHLPKTYCTVIGSHHSSYRGEIKGVLDYGDKKKLLSAIAHLADLCNGIFTCHDKAAVMTLLNRRAKRLFDLAPQQINTLLGLLPEQTQEAMAAMKMPAAPMADFQNIMDQASRKLAKDNLGYIELTWKLQQTLRDRDEYAACLDKELTAARQIQTGLLPDLSLVSGAAAFNMPALHLSGDFYDYIEIDKDCVFFCLGDVSGKGTSAALLMTKTLTLIKWMCRTRPSLTRMMAQLNQALYDTSLRGMFVTLAAGYLNPQTGALSLVNMGHPPLLLAPKKRILQFRASGPPLGIVKDLEVSQVESSLKDARLYLYSDGFIEERPGKINRTSPGPREFLRWLVQSGQEPVKEQARWIKNRCQKEFNHHCDDLTLMILSHISD